jgi:hypothetical protein
MPERSGEFFRYAQAQRPNSSDREAALNDGRGDDHHRSQNDLDGQKCVFLMRVPKPPTVS